MTVSFAPFPPAALRYDIPPKDWETCIDAWILLAQRSLALNLKVFALQLVKDQSPIEFLVSFVRENAEAPTPCSDAAKSARMKRLCFLLTHRLLTTMDPVPSALLEWGFLADFCTVYARSKALRPLISTVWRKSNLLQRPDMQESKRKLMKLLEIVESNASVEPEQHLRRVAGFLKASYDYGQFLMLGSDAIDSLTVAWSNASTVLQKKLIAITYLALFSLLEGEKPNASLLLDHLYGLKQLTEKARSNNANESLLAGVTSSTLFIHKLQERIKGPEAARTKPLITYLRTFKSTKHTMPKKQFRQKVSLVRAQGNGEYDHNFVGAEHVHKLSMITQVQDLFPDLGAGFVVRLLDEYNDNTELVITHLLEGDLPQHLQNSDRSEEMLDEPHPSDYTLVPDLSTPPLLPSRKNVFDDDELDNLSLDTSKLHFGRKDPNLTADELLADKSSAPSKAAILSALAAFDSDEDERDDTYDAADVGGTVDSAIPGSVDADTDLRDGDEQALFQAYKMDATTFERDAYTRRQRPRLALQRETGMTDEAIEGWAIMLQRDPRKLRRLEAKYSMFTGEQRALASTSYREGLTGSGNGSGAASGADESGTEDDSDAGVGGSGNRGRDGGGLRMSGGSARDRGPGDGGHRGGHVTGPANVKETQVARQRKEGHKASRANHNRKNQRGKKVARAGGMVG
ncbi:MAG: hypothetical protein MMC33_001695 [Icmadophila ericetorum]|nr:hypothetical protein [Icmadophila ericetorum]